MRSAPARSTTLRLALVTLLLLGAGCPRAGAKASTAWPSKVHGRAVDDAGEGQQKVVEQKEATRHAGGGGGTSGASEGSPRVRLGVPGRPPAAACGDSGGVASHARLTHRRTQHPSKPSPERSLMLAMKKKCTPRAALEFSCCFFGSSVLPQKSPRKALWRDARERHLWQLTSTIESKKYFVF